jgi:hypothetical protein
MSSSALVSLIHLKKPQQQSTLEHFDLLIAPITITKNADMPADIPNQKEPLNCDVSIFLNN